MTDDNPITAMDAREGVIEMQSTALMDIAAERRRHVEVEGFTPEHDDTHTKGEMAMAAACYALAAALDNAERSVIDQFRDSGTPFRIRTLWPWDAEWWKPKNRRRDLVRAGSLIVAEIERLDRLSNQPEDFL